MTAPSEVDRYLEALPDAQRAALAVVRETLRRLLPDATEVMSNGLPTLIHYGPLLAYGAHASNRALCSLHVFQPKLLATMRSAIAPHTVAGGSIHFAASDPPSEALLGRIARDRARENEAAYVRSQQRNQPRRS
ncbi:MAG: hypothetical protein AB7G21_05615 [Dehalococcoidia bacterium]